VGFSRLRDLPKPLPKLPGMELGSFHDTYLKKENGIFKLSTKAEFIF
jgi:hypothetical protein